MPTPNLLRLLTVTVGDVDAWERVDDSLVQILRLKSGSQEMKSGKEPVQKFGHKIKFLFRLLAQGLVEILKLKLMRDLEAEVW